MKMQCRKCHRKMGLVEFSTYPAAYFLKLIIPVLVPAVIAAITQVLSQQTKGIIDESMAGLANVFLLACPKCKQSEIWDPISEEELVKPSKVASKKVKQIPIN